MTPTKQQAAFLQALTTTTSHLALIARAGCGKTSTIKMGVRALVDANPRLEITVCAFNKAIADEVGHDLKQMGFTDWRQVQASTLHSMGFGLLKFVFKPTVDDKKVRKLVEASNNPICQVYGQQVVQLVGYAKGEGFGFFPDRQIGDLHAWYELADHYDVNGLDETDEADAVIEAAQTIYRASLAQTDVIDFDDMILFPLVKNLRVKFGKDVIFGDEWQDMSRAKQALVRKFLKPGTGRLVMVGDDRQAIYGFAGADATAMQNGIEAMNATTLPLTFTWRCPKSVVALAQTKVPDIEAAPEAPDGEVIHVPLLKGEDDERMGWEDVIETLGPEDAILCRNTAPLIQTAYSLIRRGKPCKVEGRAIGDGLIALALRWKVKTIDAFLGRLETYEAREVQKAMAKGSEAKQMEVEDKCETLRQIAKATIEQGGTTVDAMVDFINSLFADGAKGVTTLATYHRSKGREWERVVLWEHSARCPSKAARQPWQLLQEDNLAYVAITRAKRTLVFVS